MTGARSTSAGSARSRTHTEPSSHFRSANRSLRDELRTTHENVVVALRIVFHSFTLNVETPPRAVHARGPRAADVGAPRSAEVSACIASGMVHEVHRVHEMHEHDLGERDCNPSALIDCHRSESEVFGGSLQGSAPSGNHVHSEVRSWIAIAHSQSGPAFEFAGW